ncbi:alpha/beta fold hydrolase [Bacteroidota bacterium]
MNSKQVTLLGYRHMVHSFTAEPERHALLAIHGFGATGRCFRHAAPMLTSSGISITAPDQLNFGESDKPEDGYSLRLYAQLVMETCTAVGLERPFLIGHSAGGKIAAVTVALFPNEFSGLILVNSGGFSVLAPVLLLADTALFHLVDTPVFRNRILRRFRIAETVETPEQWEAFRRFQGQNAALDIDRSGLRHSVRSIAVPTLIIWGARDRMMPRGTIKRIVRDIPHAQVAEIEDSGHSPMHDNPERFSQLVSTFIEEHSDSDHS